MKNFLGGFEISSSIFQALETDLVSCHCLAPYICGHSSCNMKRSYIFILCQAILSFIAGYLVSGISWIGSVGIRFFYGEYSVFRSWWKTGLIFLLIQCVLLISQSLVRKKAKPSTSYIVSGILLLVGAAGLFVTYNDFQHTLSHRLLKEKFHLGFYLFWLCWIANCLYFLLSKKKVLKTDNV